MTLKERMERRKREGKDIIASLTVRNNVMEGSVPVNETWLSTGIAGLDDVLRGGLARDSLFLVEGNPGTGKTTMALSVTVLLICIYYNLKIKGPGGWIHELFTAPFGNHPIDRKSVV